MKDCLIQIPLNAPLDYHMSGKFEAPSDDWMHEDFDLTDFELIIMTENVLYIEYNPIKRTIGSLQTFAPVTWCSKWWEKQIFILMYSKRSMIHFSSCAPYTLLQPDAAKETNSDSTSIRIPIQGITPNPAKLVALMKQLQSNVRDGHSRLALNYETTSLLCELYSQLTKEEADVDKLSQKQIYSDMLDYIKLNYCNNLRVSDIALHFGYNEKYLSHLFRQLSGMPLKQFILKSKIDEANYLLTDTNLSIGEIAVKLGYTDAHNFARTYKKSTGLSPSAYREAYAKRLLFHV